MGEFGGKVSVHWRWGPGKGRLQQGVCFRAQGETVGLDLEDGGVKICS